VTGLRKAALAAIGVLVAAASLVSFAESYRALYLWASHHGLHGAWAYAWPLQIDVFIAVGELALIVALADSWPPRSRAAAWAVTVLGLAVSVAGNVGHVTGHDLASRATAAVPPLAAAAALAVGLGVLKRVVAPPQIHEQLTDYEPEINQAMVDLASTEIGQRPADLAALNGHAAAAIEAFAEYVDAGVTPSIRDIRERMHVGQPKATEIQAYLRTQVRTPG
jgi:Protein of unknown function (DUF2637)